MSSHMDPVSSRRAWKPVFGLLVLLAVVAWFALPGADGAHAPGEDTGAARAQPMELAPGDVTTASRRTLLRKVPVSGTVTPLLKSMLRSKVAGEVLEVTVREGQAVSAGEVLARIDTRSQQALVASQQAALEKARADLSIARLNYENSQRLLERRFIAQNELDTVKSVHDAARAGVKLAEAQLRLAEIGLQDALVRAPFDAVVARRYAQPGEKVSGDAPLFELVDLLHMEMQAAAPASEIPSIRAGQIARVRVDGYGERRFEARLERINPSAEQGSRLILLYLALDNSDGALRGGMFAQGELLIEQTEPVLAVPARAVFNEAGLDFVMVIEQGVLRRRQVQLGTLAADDGLVEVREGLAEGERLLALHIASLEPGMPVTIVPSSPAG